MKAFALLMTNAKHQIRISRCIVTAAILTFASPLMAIDASSIIEGKEFNAASHQARNAVARDILKKVRSFSNYVPALKPDELAWVQEESAAINKLESAGESKDVKTRRIEYEISPEVRQQNLRIVLADLQTALSCAASASKPIREEMKCWSVASFLLTDHSMLDDSIGTLLKTGRISKDLIGDTTAIHGEPLNYGDYYEWYGRGILERILIPYLKNQIK